LVEAVELLSKAAPATVAPKLSEALDKLKEALAIDLEG